MVNRRSVTVLAARATTLSLAMQIPVGLDRNLRQPLALQLADQLREAVRQGRIPRGARLPSSRRLAEQLGLGRNTVVRVYEILIMEGLLEARAASGVFASLDLGQNACRPTLVMAGPGSEAERPSLPAPPSVRVPPRIEGGRQRLTYDFIPGRPNQDLFPVKTWRRLLQSCSSYRAAAGLSERGDPAGLYELRAAIAAHVSIGRGLVADAERVLIVSGTQQALSLLSRLFAAPTVVIEDPCYQGAACAFEAAGARVLGVRVDDDGLVTAELPAAAASLVYVTPAHQYPTGATLSALRRRELIAWARKNAAYIIEDDYDSEFHYDESPLQALAGVAPECTIHLGTFSTTLGPGLRLGYMIVPASLVEPLRAAKALLDGGNSWLDQAALAELLRTGSYGVHLTRSRARYRESRDALLSALRRHFGRVEISGESAGLHLCWQLPAGVPGATRLEELARRHRVGIYSLARAGAREYGSSVFGRRSVLLGYAGLTAKQIEQGIARLSDAVDDALDDHHDFLDELLLDAPRTVPARSLAGKRKASRRESVLRRPAAIHAVAPLRNSRRTPEDRTPMRTVRAIYRYPIKGLSPQAVPGVTLEAGQPFPFDRLFALVRPGVSIDRAAPRWAKKGLFLMLMLEDSLASVRTHLDVETLRFDILKPLRAPQANRRSSETLLSVDLGTEDGRQAVEDFFHRQVPKLKGKPTLVRSREGHFMDKPDNVLSCINLATLRSLEADWGCAVHPLRFRANFYIEGLAPWEEFDWIGSDIRVGDVQFRVDRRNGRCGATNVNPVTGERDLDIPGLLRKTRGHKDLGVYLVSRTSGKVVVGDPVVVPEVVATAVTATPSSFVAPNGPGTFICRGCYYLYDEATGALGVPRGTPFEAVSEDFRCPDCGTEKANFRRYSPETTLAEGA